MPWLRLLRLPNLFTIVLLAVTSVFIYAFGVMMNDLVDYQEDCIHRPERPLPSGRINRQQATWICVQLWIIASICCPGSSISIFLLHIDSNSLFVFGNKPLKQRALH